MTNTDSKMAPPKKTVGRDLGKQSNKEEKSSHATHLTLAQITSELKTEMKSGKQNLNSSRHNRKKKQIINEEVKSSLKIENSSRKNDSLHNKDVQGVLHQTVTLTPKLTSYKIPKKKAINCEETNVNGMNPPKTQPVKNKVNQEIHSQTVEKKNGKNELRTPQITTPKSSRKHSTVAPTTTKSAKAPASHPSSGTIIDTPQMTMLRERIAKQKKGRKPAGRDEKNKGVHGEYQALTPAPCLFQSPQTSIQNNSTETSGARLTPSDSVLGEVGNMDAYNPVPEILQLVKNDEQEDMIEAMDIDIIQSTPSQSKQMLIIFDTNVWINDRHLIQEILKTNVELLPGSNSKHPLIIIPWMVLQEIDHNIHNKNKPTGFRSAARFIHQLLKSKHPRVKGQKATEAIIGMEFNELMADDSILNCAIQYDKLPQFRTAFVTNDINLLNKALVHNLNAYQADNELIKNLGKLALGDDSQISPEVERFGEKTQSASSSFIVSNSFCLSSPFSVPPSPKTTLDSSNVTFCDNMDDALMEVDDPMGNDESDNCPRGNTVVENQYLVKERPTFEVVCQAMQEALTSIIVPTMVEEFKEGWKFALKIKPPYSVQSGLKCLQAHWIAVFSFRFSQRAKDVLDQLLNAYLQIPRGTNSMEDIKAWQLNICQLAKILLLSLNHNKLAKATGERVANCCRLIQEYVEA